MKKHVVLSQLPSVLLSFVIERPLRFTGAAFSFLTEQCRELVGGCCKIEGTMMSNAANERVYISQQGCTVPDDVGVKSKIEYADQSSLLFDAKSLSLIKDAFSLLRALCDRYHHSTLYRFFHQRTIPSSSSCHLSASIFIARKPHLWTGSPLHFSRPETETE
jgi:hypothetical protein